MKFQTSTFFWEWHGLILRVAELGHPLVSGLPSRASLWQDGRPQAAVH
jgi:hypothetical protein